MIIFFFFFFFFGEQNLKLETTKEYKVEGKLHPKYQLITGTKYRKEAANTN